VQPAGVLPATDCLERADDATCHVERLLVEAEGALVARHRVRGHERTEIISTQDPAAVLEGALVEFQGLTELTEQPVIDRDVAPDVERALVVYPKDSFKFTQDAHVKD